MLKSTLLCTALFVFGSLAASPVRTVADFRTPDSWILKKAPNVSAEFRPDGLLRLEWKNPSPRRPWNFFSGLRQRSNRKRSVPDSNFL